MRKILIIGSSFSIRETFSKKFINDKIYFCNFRTIWDKRNLDFYDVIILSGYHHYILQEDLKKLNEYIYKYSKFLIDLKLNTNSLFLISTYIPNKLSFSKVAFFYREIIEKTITEKNIKILYFKKIIDSRNRNSLLIKILKIIGIKFTTQNQLINNTDNFYLEYLPNPKFYFLKIKRPKIIEMLLRLLDFD